MSVVEDLKDAGVQARMEPARGAGNVELLAVSFHGRTVRFAVVRRGRAPYPTEVAQLEKVQPSLLKFGSPLLLASQISVPVQRLLRTRGWSWADEQGSYDIRSKDVILRQTVALRRHSSRPRVGIPQGRLSLAMVRQLLCTTDRTKVFTATGLAELVGASQAAASQLLGALEKADTVERQGRSAWKPKREQLLDQFLHSYEGPRGAERYAYTLESLYDAAGRIASSAYSNKANVLISADLGPDSISPWRVPAAAVIYVSTHLDLSGLNLVAAHDRSDANIIVRTAKDASIFQTKERLTQKKLPLVDIPQMLWDLQDLGGDDREEAADKLKQWFLSR